MNKPEIAWVLNEKYGPFITYINGLTPEEYFFTTGEKWSAAEQLNHIVLCVKPMVQVLSMDTAMIEKTFGRATRVSSTYEALATEYQEKLHAGGKAPSTYVPKPITADERATLTTTLAAMIKEICAKMDNFSEENLDELNIPHPLLGNITMRDMLYNTADHVEHHLKQAMRNLENR